MVVSKNDGLSAFLYFVKQTSPFNYILIRLVQIFEKFVVDCEPKHEERV